MQFLLELESVSSLAGHALLFLPYLANPDRPLSISWVALNAVAILPFSTATHKRRTEEAIKPQLEPFNTPPSPESGELGPETPRSPIHCRSATGTPLRVLILPFPGHILWFE